MQSRAWRPMLADGAPYCAVVVVVGCVTRGTARREKQTLPGVGGRTGFFGEEKTEGRRIGEWERSDRLEASNGAQYCAPKATLEDHIALEMEPSGLNAPWTSHSECHTFRAPLSGFHCIMCMPLNATNTWGGKPQCTHGPTESNWGELSPMRTYEIKCGCKTELLLHRPRFGHSNTKNLNQRGLPFLWWGQTQVENNDPPRWVGARIERLWIKRCGNKCCTKQPQKKTIQKKIQIEARKGNCRNPSLTSAAIFSDPFRIPTRPPNSTWWDEVGLNHDSTKPSHPLDTCSIVPTPPPSQWQESAKGIGGDAPALRAAGKHWRWSCSSGRNAHVDAPPQLQRHVGPLNLFRPGPASLMGEVPSARG